MEGNVRGVAALVEREAAPLFHHLAGDIHGAGRIAHRNLPIGRYRIRGTVHEYLIPFLGPEYRSPLGEIADGQRQEIAVHPARRGGHHIVALNERFGRSGIRVFIVAAVPFGAGIGVGVGIRVRIRIRIRVCVRIRIRIRIGIRIGVGIRIRIGIAVRIRIGIAVRTTVFQAGVFSHPRVGLVVTGVARRLISTVSFTFAVRPSDSVSSSSSVATQPLKLSVADNIKTVTQKIRIVFIEILRLSAFGLSLTSYFSRIFIGLSHLFIFESAFEKYAIFSKSKFHNPYALESMDSPLNKAHPPAGRISYFRLKLL